MTNPTTDLAARFEAKRDECEAVVKKWIGHSEVVEAAWRNRASAFAEARDMARADAVEGKQVRDEDGFVCEYDPGCKPETDTYTICWDGGARWLIVDRHGLITAGQSPAENRPVQQTTWQALMSPPPAQQGSSSPLREGETVSGASPSGSGWSAEPEPVPVSALAGDHPSRGEVDYDDLNRLFAQIPEGPWHPIRTGSSHEIRQIDTDPTNKHHWPFRLCQSITGQRAGCDDAAFAFIAGVLNAWPTIAAANSDDAYIERVLAMPEDELRKRFLVDGQSPEQAETISRQAFDLAVLKVALTQIHDQYIINRGDMTDAEAIGAIKRIAAKALGVDPAIATLSATDQADE